jgi:toxin ParE1/3/4
MTTAFILSPRAVRDFEQIWIYTAETWNEAQADAYIRQLVHHIEIVAREPGRRRTCLELGKAYFKSLSASHVVFYRLKGSAIDVVRVLHQRSDFEQPL